MTEPMPRQVTSLKDVPLLPAEVMIDRRADGSILARAPQPLGAYPAKTTVWLEHWAREGTDRPFIAQRDGAGPWNTITYGQTYAAARAIGTALLARPLSAQRPIAILSGNDLGQALLGFAAQMIGVPFAPISPAYALMSQDFGKLRYVLSLLNPGLIYVASGTQFARAIEAVVPADVEIVYAADPPPGRANTTSLQSLIATIAEPAVDAANAVVGPDTVVKFLFTSGSTGNPKAVINTQRMLTANAEMVCAAMPFLNTPPLVLVDWLPWSHTFAGNHNVNVVLRCGGTLYIDEGRPMAGAIETTVANLKDIAPTIYLTVPRGFEALLPYLKSDAELRRSFFSRLQAMFYAGASLPQHVWDGLQDVAVQETGHQLRMITGLGSTETAPGAVGSTNRCSRSGMVGLPLPGVELKLVPNDGKLEARVRGPNVTPGYWKQPDLTKAAFDEEGFYKLGDALKFVDAEDPGLGFLFDGRVAEDFKLTTGTWVSVGPLRAELIQTLAPLVRDVVITGHDRGFLGAMLVPELQACRTLGGLEPTATAEQVYCSAALHVEIKRRLSAHARAQQGSSTKIMRALILSAPLSLDAGEVTDKGSVNQRAVIASREGLVEALYAADIAAGVIAM
jgi:feruloyl-CoA synthase